MYGMIHRALRQMTIDRLGAGAWERAVAQSEICPKDFVSSSTYDDSVTLSLVGLCAGAFKVEIPQFLEMFGEYWVVFASSGPYASLMRVAGSTLPVLLTNLDRLHQSVQAVMADAMLPSFVVIKDEPNLLWVRYCSKRTGLETFATGLLKGLMAKFSVQGTVEIINRGDAGIDYEIRCRQSV
jgi:hypothetical protein